MWNQNNPKIVVLLGPHKTASSTLQRFFANTVGLTTSLAANTTTTALNFSKPNPKISNWAWPIGVEKEHSFKNLDPVKFYAPLACLITGKPNPYFDDWKESRDNPAQFFMYFKSLFRQVWEEDANIIFGSEEFDRLIMNLHIKSSVDSVGEAIHVAPESSDKIDRLLSLFPWDDNNNLTIASSLSSSPTANVNSIPHQRSPSLRLENIEVQINYRTPRISHIESVWREVTKNNTFHEFLTSSSLTFAEDFHVTNSLALALQFARKGIKTTIVNMAGVSQTEERNKNITGELPNKNISGGLPAVVVCEILKMGSQKNSSDGLCDDQGRLRLPKLGNENVRRNPMPLNLKKGHLEQIDRAYEVYDCGVWRHLQKYQAQGTLRMLYPTKDLFASCNLNEGSRDDISFSELLERVQSIAKDGLEDKLK